MPDISRSPFMVQRIAMLFLLMSIFGLEARGQGDDTGNPASIIDPSYHGMSGSSGLAVLSASGSHVFVSVRESSGLQLQQPPMVKLNCPLTGVHLSRPAKDDGPIAQFLTVPSGDCKVEVEASGYKPVHEQIEVVQSVTNRIQYVFVLLHPESELAITGRPAVVPQSAVKEIDKGMAAMQRKKNDDAVKHLSKAAQLAPSNPDVAYLLGMLALDRHDITAAGQHFQSAVMYSPTHGRALLGLGYVQVDTNQWSSAVQTLEKALQVDGNSSRAHLLLANAYAQLQDFPKAQEHAQRAEEFGLENAAPARTLLGEVLAAEGNRDGAKLEFEGVLHDFPNAPSSSLAKAALDNLLQPPGHVISTVGLSPSATAGGAGFVAPTNVALLPSMEAAKVSAWAPPSVDSSAPGVASDVACSAEEVVERTGVSTNRQLENLEKFLATEHIQHEEVSAKGEVTQVRDKNFQYMVFTEHSKDGLVFLDERRDGGANTDEFPTSLATVGLVSLGVDVFHPGFAKALDFKCEGLGQWRGKAAWVLYFQQKPGVKSYLRLWETKIKTVEVPLKGRVWVSAGSYDVLHVESDLREPMKELELTRDHLSIDYGPVSFGNGTSELWLPWYADMYLELHGRRYHHSHTLTNFSLFSVDTTNTIGAPKNVPPPDDDPPQKP
jgi:tetratricopeptide (TPR) repeat protein